jgi:hypothetical protein
MAEICRESQEWVEETVERPIEEWENREEERCREEPCNWWVLCLNKLFCWIVLVAVKVVRIVLVTIGKWVARVVCEIVSFVVDALTFVVNLVLSIPILGGIIRTVLNWVTEIIWRAIGLIDFGLSLIGVRLTKRIYVSLLIPRSGGAPITTEAAMLPQIERARELFKSLCNIDLIYRGACESPTDAPDGSLVVGCDAGGFFSDWWLGGSFFEFSSAVCEFDGGWRRLTGYGGGIIVIPVENVTPDSATFLTGGCSFASTHNYVVVEAGANTALTAHEIGHSCWLPHAPEPENLMFAENIPAEPTLTPFQVSVVRWSKHCVYF